MEISEDIKYRLLICLAEKGWDDQGQGQQVLGKIFFFCYLVCLMDEKQIAHISWLSPVFPPVAMNK